MIEETENMAGKIFGFLEVIKKEGSQYLLYSLRKRKGRKNNK